MYQCRVKGFEDLWLNDRELAQRRSVEYYTRRFLRLREIYRNLVERGSLPWKILRITDQRDPSVTEFLDLLYQWSQSTIVKIYHIFSIAYEKEYSKALREIEQYKDRITENLISSDPFGNAIYLEDLQLLERFLKER